MKLAHGNDIFTTVDFDGILADFKAFLGKHKSEAIILHVAIEKSKFVWGNKVFENTRNQINLWLDNIQNDDMYATFGIKKGNVFIFIFI